MSTWLDFSTRDELRPLSAQVRVLRAAAGARPLFLVGARVRDLLLQPRELIPIERLTLDSDFVVEAAAWTEYRELRDRLIRDHGFIQDAKKFHCLRSREGWLDLIPFGGVEDRRRRIAWPPAGEQAMNMTGIREATAAAIQVMLPESTRIDCISLPGLVMTKLISWTERVPGERIRDAIDIGLILRKYIVAGNRERLFTDHPDLASDPDFDEEIAGARLPGRDLLVLLRKTPERLDAIRETLLSVLAPEVDPDGQLFLAGEMNVQSGNAVDLLNALRIGLTDF